MNHCYSCTTCKSADKPLECYIAGLPMETSHHRVEGQSVKCGFGLQGVCCRLCSNGPCRITPEAPHGICGASADVIVARNFLRAVAAGSGCYIHVVETTALNLKETALSGGALKGMNALEHLCGLLGVGAGQVMAIGDNENDISMLAFAGLGVAMGNAPEHVKAAADFVTKSNVEDGVAWALGRFWSQAAR